MSEFVEQIERLERLRQDLFAAIDHALEHDGHCKSTEGRFAIHFPDRHEVRAGQEEWRVSLYCYVIGPSRRYTWRGTTLAAAMDGAEHDVRQWIRASAYDLAEEGRS